MTSEVVNRGTRQFTEHSRVHFFDSYLNPMGLLKAVAPMGSAGLIAWDAQAVSARVHADAWGDPLLPVRHRTHVPFGLRAYQL